MEKSSRLVKVGGFAAGAGLLIADTFLARKRRLITLEQEMPASATAVIDLIKQVEKEQDFIPIVSSVKVHDRSDTEVRYTVCSSYPHPACVTYRKWWNDEARTVHWKSERGTLGFHHEGDIHLADLECGSIVRLRSEHWSKAPLIGRLLPPATTSIIKTGLEVWLMRMAKELAKESD